MKRYLIASLVVLAGTIGITVGYHRTAWAHCQVPCGIYDDPARIASLLEDARTINKAMAQINGLAAKNDPQSLNQLSRWVNTKEAHASHVIAVVAEYFLTQKVKGVDAGADGYPQYLEKLAMHHRVMRAAMKTKQSVDVAHADKLAAAIRELGRLYP